MSECRRRRRTRSGISGRQLLLLQAGLAGGVITVLVIKELPGIMRELRIFRMTGGPGANRRYP
ncbi:MULTISPECIES: hypothetical protein [unclassified Streptomyces]|uniref:hypothetical protein n=1 Tax=unclassified Streptomyces TaxID=2593676 RepID=UPI000DBA20CB|nr:MULTISPECIES: hypothetical protein [Streptomyces]MYU06992.1 hypothetical protein [Streptomyces sp. SID8366]MYU65326.1 hypothetical protein [Streptomyces sp. SID69]RAJ61226.1 hypothetical protein K376_02077 [Streptomyces sp. PsTaAH-130]TXJ76039.1 hypothetical protein E2C11_19700 [Streptomyces lavendulae]